MVASHLRRSLVVVGVNEEEPTTTTLRGAVAAADDLAAIVEFISQSERGLVKRH